MTLEERINQLKNNLGASDCFNLPDYVEETLEIIQELQTKNKELEAKLKNYEIVSTRRGKSVFVSSALDTKDLTRLEVIEDSGRVYVNNNCKMELSYQDEGRTLKIFVNNGELSNV